MKILKIVGILLIIATWAVAGLSAFAAFPYFSEWDWTNGLVVAVILTVIGILLIVYYGGEEAKSPKEKEETEEEEK